MPGAELVPRRRLSRGADEFSPIWRFEPIADQAMR